MLSQSDTPKNVSATRKNVPSRATALSGNQRGVANSVRRTPTAAEHETLFARRLNELLASADADQMAELIAKTNVALPDDDHRKIRPHDVRMLRRLARQARTFNTSLLDHAAQRRWVEEPRGRVSPEARNTARWAERLATALQTGVLAAAATNPAAK